MDVMLIWVHCGHFTTTLDRGYLGVVSNALRCRSVGTGGSRGLAGGIFFPLVAGRVHGQVWISIGYCNADGTTTREQLKEVAHAALADFGMAGTVE